MSGEASRPQPNPDTGADAPYELHDHLRHSFQEDIAADVRAGLTASPKTLPSKYFYDENGSVLFERICELPEYYQTRTEMKLIEGIAGELAASLGDRDLVELGSGSTRKIGLLLQAMDAATLASVRYLPLDVSLTALETSCLELNARFPKLKVEGFGADFTQQLDVLPRDRPKVLILFGSTIGNLDVAAATAFYDELARNLMSGDRFLIGLDMVKSPAIIEAAYNDSQGITAEFNRNVLRVINRELNGNFDVATFEHLAHYDEEAERVEMHLRAPRAMTVRIDKLGMNVSLAAGESIRTEICRKFERESYQERIEAAGFRVRGWHSDPQAYFSLVDLIRV